MKKYVALLGIAALLVFASLSPSVGQSVGLPASVFDTVSKALKVTQATTTAGEDVPNDVLKTELRFINIPSGGTTSRVAADQLYKSGPGYVRGISCFSDAAATAGSIVLRDNTVAGAGDILWSFDVLAADYSKPFEVSLEVPFAVGLYLDFTTTADMFCTVRYR